jgi:hypothetical protein
MERETARAFVDQWVSAWNRHDLDGVLSHFDDDVVFTSPIAARLIAGSDGVVRGKAALRAYWAEALGRDERLRFEVIATYVGVDAIVINFRNQDGRVANEVLVFEGMRVVAGHATHLDAD